MKLNEIQEQKEEKQYKIYVDMDGVLVDFVKGIKEKIDPDYTEEKYHTDKQYRNQMWKSLQDYSKKEDFWLELDEMSDAQKLWDYVKQYDPEILTATGTAVKSTADQKRKWIANHLGSDITVNTVEASGDKGEKFAEENTILIDDNEEKSIKPWTANGGVGIVHTSAENTIKQLKKLGL